MSTGFREELRLHGVYKVNDLAIVEALPKDKPRVIYLELQEAGAEKVLVELSAQEARKLSRLLHDAYYVVTEAAR